MVFMRNGKYLCDAWAGHTQLVCVCAVFNANQCFYLLSDYTHSESSNNGKEKLLTTDVCLCVGG